MGGVGPPRYSCNLGGWVTGCSRVLNRWPHAWHLRRRITICRLAVVVRITLVGRPHFSQANPWR